MLLALDVGNTNTVLALYKTSPDVPTELIADWRITTSHIQTTDEYGMLFRDLFALRKMSIDVVDAIIISSVVPPIDSAGLRALLPHQAALRRARREDRTAGAGGQSIRGGRRPHCELHRRIRTLWRTMHCGGYGHGDDI